MLRKEFININNKKVPLITGGKGCFAAGTKILMENGDLLDIELIRVGDKVVSFDDNNNLVIGTVIQVFDHEPEDVIKVYFWDGEVLVTPNHWFLTEDNSFIPIGSFKEEWPLVDVTGAIRPIRKIEKVSTPQKTYNFTVAKYHTYIANNIRVHNKGSAKSAPAPYTAPNTLFSTDILFLTVALGEGPIYRVNPHGAQDIEINESSIDDFLNLDTDGSTNTDVFVFDYRTGTVTQSVMEIFGEQAVSPQAFSEALLLRNGNKDGIPRAAIDFQDTSVNDWDELVFNFVIQSLYSVNDEGDVYDRGVRVKITVYDRLGTTIITSTERNITGKTTTPFKFSIPMQIPSGYKSSSGYKFSIEQTSSDVPDSKRSAVNCTVVGWDEIKNDKFAYPRTALAGFAIVADGENSGSIPSFSEIVKGLLCKVPSNYNQPIIPDPNPDLAGEYQIDWGQLEVGESNYTTYGYRLQDAPSTVVYDANPIIYKGLWDGSFVYSWTQNPVWILYAILTNKSWGIGIPENYIDKWRFYRIAQYCDACNPNTGRFEGVNGLADGTWRYKPNTLFTSVREKLVGLTEGTAITERRFVCDVILASQKQLVDIINQIAALFRGVLYYSGGKLSLNVDMPDDLPVALFNETNIKKESINITGISETDIITGVEISFVEPRNHYRREVLRIDDPKVLRELDEIENLSQVDLVGCTRRGQATRYAQYLLAASKYIRRKVSFTTTSTAINLTVGDVIAISQRAPGTAWGYAGRVAGNAIVTTSGANSNVILEHFTSPAITEDKFTGNTLPLGLRVISRNSDRVELYLLSNTAYNLINTSNTVSGADLLDVKAISRYNYQTKTFSITGNNIFQANNVPVEGDIWHFGEINPASFYRAQNDKLFKVTGIDRDSQDMELTVYASEYISNVYIDSDTLIDYTPVVYKDIISPLAPPPTPFLTLRTRLVRLTDGTVQQNIDAEISMNKDGYPIDTSIEIEYSAPNSYYPIEGINL